MKSKVRQFYEDLFNNSSEKYWHHEGNNKRMQFYCKISIILKVTKKLLLMGIVIYYLSLSTNTILCFLGKPDNLIGKINIVGLADYKKFVYNTYSIGFIMILFIILYYSRKNKYQIKKIVSMVAEGLLFLPISTLVVYNFMIKGSLMGSFYFTVVVAVLVLFIDSFVDRINRLYRIAVGGEKVSQNRKGDNKKCKKN